MTQQTINLYDGLEALYYFDEDYFDGTANEIKDKSGYGRHAQASGGPTVGVEGPDSFEAASFDGSDDYYSVPDMNTFAPTDKYTVTIAFNGQSGPLFHSRSERDVTFGLGNKANIEWFDGNNTTTISTDTTIDNGLWQVVTFVVDGPSGIAKIFVDGELDVNESVTYNPVSISGSNTIGKKLSDHYSGQMSFLAVHGRVLSDAEVQQLTRLTAPRRAQL